MMQPRMEKYQLNASEIEQILLQSGEGVLATVNSDGSPYATPVQFVYCRGRIYIHGRAAGQKLDNLRARPRVSFTAYCCEGLQRSAEGKPCGTNTCYRSVIAAGTAQLLTDPAAKAAALAALVAKYTPELAGVPLPEASVAKTAVIEITPEEISGKYFR